jgi:hypothetical protein
MELDWIIQEPIDYEYKQYLLLDYIKKTGDKLENFELYPAFQELSILYSSAQRVIDHGQFITFKREPEDIDDEILLIDLIYNTIRFKDSEEMKEILSIAEFASKNFKDLFMVAKSLWSIVNESISLEITNNLDMAKGGWGYFYFEYKDELYIYEYNINLLSPKSTQNKCHINKVYQGEEVDVEHFIMNNGRFGLGKELENEENGYGTDFPRFKITFDQTFPLEGCLLSLSRRKVMNYIFQSVNFSKLKTS